MLGLHAVHFRAGRIFETYSGWHASIFPAPNRMMQDRINPDTRRNVASIHAQDAFLAQIQQYGAMFMPVRAYTLAAFVEQPERYDLHLFDVRFDKIAGASRAVVLDQHVLELISIGDPLCRTAVLDCLCASVGNHRSQAAFGWG
jgi:hypothetical protein